ncbi:MAG: response regulator [Acidobacteria bacterium]|nr:response regulator [Acidobacteriota bacterium]
MENLSERSAERGIIALVEDMFFAAKIRGTAEALGVKLHLARSVEAALKLAREHHPTLIIADLHAGDPFTLAEALKADDSLRAIPLLGFFSHVHTALQQQAAQAGFDRVLPRSAFSKNLPQILEGNY